MNMQSIRVVFLGCFFLSPLAFGAEEVFRVEASSDAVLVGVNPIALVQKYKVFESKQRTCYEEKLVFGNEPGQYAAAGEGVMDAPQVIIMESNAMPQSVVADAWDWCKANPGKTATMILGPIVTGLAIQYKNEGWPFGGGDDSSDNSGAPSSSSESLTQTQLNGPIVIVDSSGSGNVSITINDPPAEGGE